MDEEASTSDGVDEDATEGVDEDAREGVDDMPSDRMMGPSDGVDE